MPVDKFGRGDYKETSTTQETSVSSVQDMNDTFLRRDERNTVIGTINMAGNTLTNLSNPVSNHDVATKAYVDENSDGVSKSVDTMSGDLNMDGNKIVGLLTRIGDLTGEGDAVSHRILLDVMERLNKLLLRTNCTNRMTGDLLMNSSNNAQRFHGMCRFRYGREKFRIVYLGNANNGLAYNTLFQSQPAVTSYTSNGFLVRVENTDVTKFDMCKG